MYFVKTKIRNNIASRNHIVSLTIDNIGCCRNENGIAELVEVIAIPFHEHDPKIITTADYDQQRE